MNEINDNSESYLPVDPTVDVCFKFLLTEPEIRLNLVNDILKESDLPHIQSLEPTEGSIPKQRLLERGASLDFIAKDDSGQLVNIEMQQQFHGNFVERLFFHFSKIHISQFKYGIDYAKQRIGPTIIIVVTNFNVTKESSLLNAYGLLHRKTFKPLKRDLVHLIFLELPKLKELPPNPTAVEYWAAFYKNEKKFKRIFEENPMIKMAGEKVREFTRDNELVAAYEDHLKLLNDEKFKLDSTRREGVEEGIELGIELGIENVALRLLDLGLSLDIIAKASNLTIEEIEVLKNRKNSKLSH